MIETTNEIIDKYVECEESGNGYSPSCINKSGNKKWLDYEKTMEVIDELADNNHNETSEWNVNAEELKKRLV